MNLREMLRPPLVAVDVRVNNWQEAVHVCGRLFHEDGATEKRFSDAMIRVAIEFGPYIVVAPGIALPHARPEDGVIKASMSAIKLSTPVDFGNAGNDPVWLVVALAAIDDRQHIQGLSELASVLSDNRNIERLKACQTPQELLEVFYSIPVGG
jgi:mannitol/fructose-specific phosphotransferase system IIA component (Ntr-type)